MIRAARSDVLARDLADRLAGASPDPFGRALVVVPTRGIERYLTQTIADRNGIAANIDFPSPDRFLAMTGGTDAWAPERVVWPVLAMIDRNAGADWCQPLTRQLANTDDWRRQDRRFAVASRIARLFAAYALQRPDMIEAWGSGRPDCVTPDVEWQYGLWRAVLAEVGVGPLEAGVDATGLPERICIFGPTRLPETLLRTLRGIAQDREIALYLPVASTALWDGPGWVPSALRRDDDSRRLARHPLLRSLGRETRELRQRLGPSGRTLDLVPDPVPDLAPDPVPDLGSVLGRLQRDIRDNAPSSLAKAAPDGSLQVHACHGAMRQVEVAREVILGLLQERPGLQPRDILIMAPDLATYSPLLSAAFGDRDDAMIGDLRLKIADRTKEQANEVLAALDDLLALLSGRMRRSEVLDLLQRPVVRNRFGLSERDVERVDELTVSAGIRWGLDPAHRAEAGLRFDPEPAGRALEARDLRLATFDWGLDRMALGAAMSDEELALFGDVLPLPDVTSTDINLLGRLADFLARLDRLRRAAAERRPADQWRELLAEALADFTAAGFADSWQDAHALGTIQTQFDTAGEYGSTVVLGLADVRGLLASALAGRPTRTGFRLGGITACQLEPMRSVPYRVICILGMDDVAFPRRGSRDGDDILLAEPRVGERDARSEDRQLFLDAVMAATETLVLTYTGRDERSNAPRQPAVPVAELLALFDDPPLTHHRLQPFDPGNFDPAAPFSHDTAALAGARAMTQPRRAPGPLIGPLPVPLDPDPGDGPTLDELTDFLANPMRAFLAARLSVAAERSNERPDERLPTSLDPLDGWTIGDRLLGLLLDGESPEAHRAAAVRSGRVPPGAPGDSCIATVDEAVEGVRQRVDAARDGHPSTTREVPLPWAPGLTGTIAGLHGPVLVRHSYSKLKPEHALRIWPSLLCLHAADPDRPWRAVFVGRDDNWSLRPPADPSASAALLQQLVACYRDGLAAPPPMSPGAAYEYAKELARSDRARALNKARDAWEGGAFPANGQDEAALIYGHRAPFPALLAARPTPQEREHDPLGELSRFEVLARLIWTPILSATERKKRAAKRTGGGS